MKRVTKRKSKDARRRAHKIINDVHSDVKLCRFSHRVVGSIAYNSVLEVDGKYDVDYQLFVNDPEHKFDANDIHKEFSEAFKNNKNRNEKIDDSTSVITLHCSKSEEEYNPALEVFSMDFAIIRVVNDFPEIVKRDQENPNNYIWNQLETKHNATYEKFNNFTPEEKVEVIEEKVLPRKEKELVKPKEDRTKSYIIFIESVNEYWSQKYGNR